MSMPQRLGLLLLGLLFLAGAVHGPMHHEGQDCGTFALCSGGVVTMFAATLLGMALWLQVVHFARPEAVCLASHGAPERAFGRAPPH